MLLKFVLTLCSMALQFSLSPAFSQGLINQNCFQPGECRDSLYIKGEPMQDEFACLELCKSEPECAWTTYFPRTSYCQLYSTCPTLDSEYCEDCLSSQKECIPDDPVCWVGGECKGVVHHTEMAASAEECLHVCNSTATCRWFTFKTEISECILFKSCSTLDESCEECVSGERRCIEETSTTTTETPIPKEYVALVVGGQSSKSVELYSPSGKCQHKLADIPIADNQFYTPSLAFINDKIIACPSFTNDTNICFEYKIQINAWTKLTSLSYYHLSSPGVVHNNKLYIIDDDNPEVYDFNNDSWSSWPTPSIKPGGYSSLISWRDSIIAFGGYNNKQGVQKFNSTTNDWSILDIDFAPFEMYGSGAVTLPNNEVLVTGPYDMTKKAALFNLEKNTCKLIEDTTYRHYSAPIVNLSGRFFLLSDPFGKVIEEFHPENNTWSQVEPQLIAGRYYYSALAVPAELFSHLQEGCEGI